MTRWLLGCPSPYLERRWRAANAVNLTVGDVKRDSRFITYLQEIEKILAT